MLQHPAFHYLKRSTCLCRGCASAAKAHQTPALPTVCVSPIHVPLPPHWSLFPCSTDLQHACLHRILKWFGLEGPWRLFNANPPGKGKERSWSFKEYGRGYSKYFPDPLWTKANLAVGEVGVMLLYFDVKDVLRKAKALQPSRIVRALGDASPLSVLSSRNGSLIFRVQACADFWSEVPVQFLASHSGSLNPALWCWDAIFILSPNWKCTVLNT